VPSALMKNGLPGEPSGEPSTPPAEVAVSGNSFNQVSSPKNTTSPPLVLICASHVSCAASEELVSLSAKLSIRSRKEGTEPVVSAFTRGMVTVGGVACAVKGMAAPERMRLHTEEVVRVWSFSG